MTSLITPPLIAVTCPAPPAGWDELAAADTHAGITQTRDWFDCIRRTTGHRDASRLYRFADDRRILLPLARPRAMPGPLAVAESWPFDWGIGGPLADGPIGPNHTRAVYHDLAAHHGLAVGLRIGPLAPPCWHLAPTSFRRTEHHTHVLDLTGGFAQVRAQRFSSAARTAIRKAERCDLQIQVDRTGALIPVFYELYRQSIARWATRAHEPLALARWRARRANPERKFRLVAQRLGGRCAVWVAWRDGQPAAAIIVLTHLGHSKYWRGAMDKTLAGDVRANDLLHARAVQDACTAGARFYNMGDARPGSGLARFKTGLGAVAHPTPAYGTERLPLTAGADRLKAAAKHLLAFQDL